MTRLLQKLNPRERLFVAVGGAAIALMAALQLVALPLLNWRARAIERAATAQEGYRLVSRSAAAVAPVRAAPPTSGPVRAAVAETAAALGVTLTFVNARPDGSVDSQAGPVAPELIYALFAALEAEHGIEIQSADIVRVPDDPNLVQAQAVFARRPESS